jgi:putative ABC transport system substrate-binding protein
MIRRDFLTLLGGAAAAWPLAARAQQGERMRRIGMLTNVGETDPEAQPRVVVFRQTLEQLGWSVGRNIQIEYRWSAGNNDLLKAHATELLHFSPEVIVATTNQAVAALRRETSTVPIVFLQVADPVALGFVTSLSRPGGNVTGFMNFEPAIGGKWIEIIRELTPGVARVALIFNPNTAPNRGSLFLHSIETAASSFAIQPVPISITDPVEMRQTIDVFVREPNSAVIVLPDPFTTAHRGLIYPLMAQHRLPAMYPFRYFVAEGGLMSYGVDPTAQVRGAASYVDRILRGAKPNDLPVQAPIKFELIFNLKTAKALGLAVSESFLLRAHEVIE